MKRKSPETLLNFLINIHEDSVQSSVYFVLSKEIPELGLCFKKAKTPPKVKELENYLGVYIQDIKGLNKIEKNLELRFFKNPKTHLRLGKTLEKTGKIPKGTAEAVLSRYLNLKAKEHNNTKLWLRGVNKKPIKKNVFESLIKNAIKNSIKT